MKKDVLYMPGMMIVLAILLLASVVLLMLRMPAEAGERCIRIAQVSGYETLVNTCNSCRNVRVIRDRTGLALPTNRSYRMERYGKQELFFKGPGRTRVISDESCGLEAGINQIDKRKADKAAMRCVVPMQTESGIVMANGCNACRKIVVERQFAEGLSILTPYAIESKGVMTLASDGAMQAKIVDDKPCNI